MCLGYDCVIQALSYIKTYIGVLLLYFRSSLSSSTWQPNDSFCTESTVVADGVATAVNGRNSQADGYHDHLETDDKHLLQGCQKQIRDGENRVPSYDNAGFIMDENNRTQGPRPDDEYSQSDETGTSYSMEDGGKAIIVEGFKK